MDRVLLRKFVAVALAGASLASMAIAEPAMAQQAQKSYSIPAQDLKDALEAFGRKSGRSVVFEDALTVGARSKAVSGTLTADAALGRLLSGTGLTFRMANANTYVIQRANLSALDSGEASDQRGISEILVIGTNSQNVDIRRTENDTQPYVVFDREEIEKSQALNLEDFLRERLPMNTTEGSNAQSVNTSNIDSRSAINLRGLGLEQTLILIDGRRAPRGAVSGADLGQADIFGLPMESIERIEVLPATAGGIYGGGAVGGVINIVRKRDYSGVSARLDGSGTFRGGGEQVRASLSGGFSLFDGRTRVSLNGSYTTGKPLRMGDNDLWRRGRELYFAAEPEALILGYTTKILSNTRIGGIRQPLVLDDGTCSTRRQLGYRWDMPVRPVTGGRRWSRMLVR